MIRNNQNSLTSELRSILRLTAFQIRVAAPFDGESGIYAGVPCIALYVLDWEVQSGDSSNPVYFPEADYPGNQEEEEDLRAILRRWWSGG